MLGAQDVQTAFDSVRHVDALQTFGQLGACPHQLLAIARDMAHNKVELVVPNVATTRPIDMTKALRTGGKAEPHVFVRMF